MDDRLTEHIQIRDPFILPVTSEQRYYLFGTTDKDCWGAKGVGFDVYRSFDLNTWEGPFPAFRPPAGFWATHHFWAPECHLYQGRYYVFASFKSENASRGTQVLVADRPEGTYHPHSDGPVTPRHWESLDGTLHINAGCVPWMVFCHEWIQIRDGAVCVVRLSPDLRSSVGEPATLFHATEAPWSVPIPHHPESYITDGPFVFRNLQGALCMLWSTIGIDGYTLGYAISENGKITGPWTQHSEPLFRADGGHGMLFHTFGGQLMLTIHQPNQTPHERAQFFPVKETAEGRLVLERGG